MKAVFLDFGTYYPQGLNISSLENAVEDFIFHDHTAHNDVDCIITRCKGAQIVLTNKVPITAEIIAQCPDLKLIAVGATGYNIIDMDAAKNSGILVTNVKGYSTPCVTQHVFALILNLRTQMLRYYRDVKEGKWQKCRDFCFLDYPITEIEGTTLGIIGYGDLGRKVEGIAKAFGMQILIADHKEQDDIRAGRTRFEDVVKQADVLTIHCPLNDDTENLIAMDELKAMKDSAILINTARGGIVNEIDLANAVREGIIAGAGVDVLSQEPPRDDNPLLAADLIDVPNLIITPHTAWASREACQRLFDQLADIINAYRAGAPVNVVQ